MTTTTMRTDNNGPPRKTLASQLDRLDSILDGLDNALAGAVQAVVCTAVKEAVQAVLTEVLTNQQLQQATQQVPPRDETPSKQSMVNRLWQATTEGVRRTVQKVKQLGRGVGVTLVAAGGVLAGIIYAARKRIALVSSAVYGSGKRLLRRTLAALTPVVPRYALGGG